MIIRPDMRHYQIFDVLIEFKYVGLKPFVVAALGFERLCFG